MVHASEPVAADIGRALRVALDSSPDDVGLHYWDTLLAVLGDTLRSTLEMDMKNWKPRSDWGKRFLADTMAKGRTQGRTEERAASIVELLAARGIPVDPPLRQRITACSDYQVLTQWLRRAATATSADEVFA